MNRKCIFTYVLLVILAGILGKLPLTGIMDALRTLAANGIYVGIVCHWSISANRRIMQRRIRMYVLLIVVCMLFLLLLRILRNTMFFQAPAASRFLWYLTYLPMLLVPLLSYYATLYIGRAPDWHQSKAGYVLMIPTLAITALVMTNDAHQYAFRFNILTGTAGLNGTYTYGAVYYAAVFWIFFLLSLSLWRLLKRCRLSNAVHRLRTPLAGLLVCGLWLALYSLDPPPHIFNFGGVPVIYCAMIITTWESLLFSGLIPANSSYDALFAASTIAAQITDSDYNVVYKSELSDVLPKDILRRAESSPIQLDDDHYLNSTPISGGHLLWTEDFTQINANLAKLRQTQTMLEESRELLSAEYALRKNRTHVDIQNRLYDRIASEIRPQLGILSSTLSNTALDSESFGKDLASICVIGAYVKRRSNLMLLCENSPFIAAAELEHCIHESLEYLTVYGVSCSMAAQLGGSISGEQAKLVYDLFEAAAELALPGLTALLVNLTSSGGLTVMKIVCENASQTLSPDWQQQRISLCGGRLDVSRSDRESYISLSLQKGGEAI